MQARRQQRNRIESFMDLRYRRRHRSRTNRMTPRFQPVDERRKHPIMEMIVVNHRHKQRLFQQLEKVHRRVKKSRRLQSKGK